MNVNPITDTLALNHSATFDIQSSYSEEVWFKYNKNASNLTLPTLFYIFYKSPTDCLKFDNSLHTVTLYTSDSMTGASLSVTVRNPVPLLAVWSHAIVTYSSASNAIQAYVNLQSTGVNQGTFNVNRY